MGEWGEERGEGRVRGEGEESRRRELEKVGDRERVFGRGIGIKGRKEKGRGDEGGHREKGQSKVLGICTSV